MISTRIVSRMPRLYTLVPRFYSAAQPKTLRASTFALPKETNPFQLTRLVAGHTNLKIAITDRAKEKLHQIAEEDKNEDIALRIRVESGGCHGFQYHMDLTSTELELQQNPDLVVFQRTDSKVARVMFDESLLEILQDSKVDYTKELIGSQFKIVDSPYTSTACGCGSSFDFDFEKLQRAKESA